MENKCRDKEIDFLHIPLSNTKFYNFYVSFFKLLILLIKNKNLTDVFVFEGREHTLTGLTKLFFPFLWKGKKLVRIRGQAQKPRKSFITYLLYKYLTDKIIYTGYVVKDRMPYQFPESKTQVCYYGKTSNFPPQTTNFYYFKKFNYEVRFDEDVITYVIVGRFDPVKGHDYLIESFIKADFKGIKTQLICIGTRQSTSAEDLYNKYKENKIFTNHLQNEWLYSLSSEDEQKKILLIETHFEDVSVFMKHATFSVISSLASETICRVGVEFLQAGVPVIYSDAGALPEVFIDFPDYKFTAGNVNELIEKFEYSGIIFQNKEKFLQEKEKAFRTWEEKFQGDIYQNILL